MRDLRQAGATAAKIARMLPTPLIYPYGQYISIWPDCSSFFRPYRPRDFLGRPRPCCLYL